MLSRVLKMLKPN